MEHSFDIEIAKHYGINCAIILKHIYFWVDHNRANEKHFYDGHYWTYNSVKAFSEQFAYLGEKQIRNAIENLENEGLIIIGNYNKDSRDKTKWYSVTKKGEELLLSSKRANAFVERANANSQKGEPLPNTITDNNNIINNNITNNKDFNNTKDFNNNKKEKENIKRKRSIDSETVNQIIDYLNKVCGTKYRATTKSTVSHIQARLKEGFKVEDFVTVIDKKTAEWKGTNYEKYLRPETLFGTKFESYLNQKGNTVNQDNFDVDSFLRGRA